MKMRKGREGGFSRQEALPQLIEQRPEAVRAHGVLEVQAIAVELGDAAGGDDDAGLVGAKLEDVEGVDEGPAERGGQPVVGGRGEGEQVDGRGGFGADDGTAGVAAAGADGDGEEGGHGDGG